MKSTVSDYESLGAESALDEREAYGVGGGVQTRLEEMWQASKMREIEERKSQDKDCSVPSPEIGRIKDKDLATIALLSLNCYRGPRMWSVDHLDGGRGGVC